MGHHHHHHHHNHQQHHMLRLIQLYGGSKKGGGMVQLPPKGCMAIRVGQKEEEQERFVVPVVYLNHPLFIGLLKEAEDEYGFDHKGAITIPCQVEHFRHVRRIIDRDTACTTATATATTTTTARGGGGGGSEHHHHFHLPCFKA